MSEQGAKVWFISDGYLVTPIGDDMTYKNHEAVCVINATDKDAHLEFDFYFADREPIKGVEVVVPAERCHHIRLDVPEQVGGYRIPSLPWRLRGESSLVAAFLCPKLVRFPPFP
ncbi:MAG: sensory rhodopsin transducer, partial [Aggregatilineaceae bacterium]